MRVTKQQAAENRTRILTEAARLFRERGLSGVGVDALTEAAGLTHGSLYSRFGSKEQLAAEALGHALSTSSLARLPEQAGRDDLAAAVTRYLAPSHRDAPGQGCALAALGCEMARQPAALREVFTEALKERVRVLSTSMPGGDSSAEAKAIALLAGMVGAMVLARAVDDPAFSDRVLQASRDTLLGRIEDA
ncbi:TetR/AcrR family transcriptional regulator [Falsiroseomonas sp. HW251]|uniref:TetR/AcrR family transcriptional regulator n=1 Tax=Falsiroseomonas sp. HW251 TaxID=3390998 RepID=UPI003D31350B